MYDFINDLLSYFAVGYSKVYVVYMTYASWTHESVRRA